MYIFTKLSIPQHLSLTTNILKIDSNHNKTTNSNKQYYKKCTVFNNIIMSYSISNKAQNLVFFTHHTKIKLKTTGSNENKNQMCTTNQTLEFT